MKDQKKSTQDERYLITLYEEGKKKGDLHAKANKFEIGRMVGMQKTAVVTITKLLLRCNFIKQEGDEEVYLTPHGVRFVEEIV